jgi:hypothetical protein
MPRNTYEDDLGPTAGVYEDVHLIVFHSTLNDMRAPLVNIFFLLSSPFLLFSCVHRSV